MNQIAGSSAFTPMYVSNIHLVDYPRYNGQTDVPIGLLGVPFDQGVCNRPGARFAPRAIRLANSMQFNKIPYGWEHFFPKGFPKAIYDFGDLNLDYGSVQNSRETMQNFLKFWLKKGTQFVTLGGDHSISYPFIKAYSQHFQQPISLIHFDSHSDTWLDSSTQRIDHGSVFYHAAKEGFIDTKSSVQIGIRSFNSDNLGVPTFDTFYLHEHGVKKTMERALEILKGKICYLTFDVDFLDPAYAPGTGTPVCGGFSTFQALEALKMLKDAKIVGADLVELNPAYDHADISALAASTVMQAEIALLEIQP